MDHGHQEIGQEHMLSAMMTVDDSLIRKLIEKMGIAPEAFQAQIEGLYKNVQRLSAAIFGLTNI